MIPGPNGFDLVIFLGCLLAMLLSKPFKQFAIAICLGVSLWGVLINTARMYELITASMIYSLAGIVEFFSALGLIFYAKWLIKDQDRQFFLLMAMFLVLSAAFNAIYIPIYLYTDFLTFELYQAAFQSTAVAHVLTMLWWSNGIRSTVTNLRSFWIRYNAHYSNR